MVPLQGMDKVQGSRLLDKDFPADPERGLTEQKVNLEGCPRQNGLELRGMGFLNQTISETGWGRVEYMRNRDRTERSWESTEGARTWKSLLGIQEDRKECAGKKSSSQESRKNFWAMDQSWPGDFSPAVNS